MEDAVAKHLLDKLNKETRHSIQEPKAKFLSGTALLNQSDCTRTERGSKHLCPAATQDLPFPVLAPFLPKIRDVEQGVHHKVSLCRCEVKERGRGGGHCSSLA